jgi:hypothetical protein
MKALDKQLARHAEHCERLDACRWKLALTNGHVLTVAVRRDEPFLLLDADTGLRPSPEQLGPLLEGSRELPAAVKFALRGSNTLRLCAEFPLPEDDTVSDRVREHLEGIRSGHSLCNWISCEAAGEGMACLEPVREGQAIVGSLVEVLKEAGWPCHERPGGTLLADLETGGQFLQAEIGRCGAGARFQITLYRNDAPGDAAQQALCLYLLEANAALRYARAFLRRDGEAIAGGFEVRVETGPAPTEAAHALAALSVAGRHCAKEMEILKDDTVAGIYRLARPL